VYAVKINNQLNEAEYNLYLIIAAERVLENIDHKTYIFEHDIRSQVKKTKETGSGIASKTQPLVDGILDK